MTFHFSCFPLGFTTILGRVKSLSRTTRVFSKVHSFVYFRGCFPCHRDPPRLPGHLTPCEGLRDFLLLQLRKTNALLTTEKVKNTNTIILSVLIWVLWFQKYYFHSCLFNITHYFPGCFAHCFPFHLRCIAYIGRSCVANGLRTKPDGRSSHIQHPVCHWCYVWPWANCLVALHIRSPMHL